MNVTLEHLAGIQGFSPAPGLCRRGARAWFDRHGLDWHAFRHEGIDVEVLERIGDPFAQAVVAHARAQEAARGIA
ncbi:hypothetical protein KR767_04040 [Luteibacter anthropi]|uniref:hypothetical protein n=1 Tax=Luteibacter anthropi TaxID=564369 RepID=UPI00203318F1|nr:hypothetical protein [Luteibacter anthropi]URX63247.1 hypothetical protein KR767_04040 [Luteibacter anthropi]